MRAVRLTCFGSLLLTRTYGGGGRRPDSSTRMLRGIGRRRSALGCSKAPRPAFRGLELALVTVTPGDRAPREHYARHQLIRSFEFKKAPFPPVPSSQYGINRLLLRIGPGSAGFPPTAATN